jgi:hypothetical protein
MLADVAVVAANPVKEPHLAAGERALPPASLVDLLACGIPSGSCNRPKQRRREVCAESDGSWVDVVLLDHEPVCCADAADQARCAKQCR